MICSLRQNKAFVSKAKISLLENQKVNGYSINWRETEREKPARIFVSRLALVPLELAKTSLLHLMS